MRTTTKIVGFLVTLVVVGGAAFGVGKIAGPVAQAAAAHGEAGHGADGLPQEGQSAMPDTTSLPGLMVSEKGYQLRPSVAAAAPGPAVPVSFAIIGPDGEPVTAFDVEHEKELHLIAVRRDFSGFQHVHPTMDQDGVWTTPLDLTPGQWRLFADFKATGAEPLTLGTDLAVGGTYQPNVLDTDTRTAEVDGYTVTLAGDLVAGTDSKLRLTVTRDGRPVTDLEPYLGAFGHLVALRGGDLAYLHVHPEGTPGDGETSSGPDVVFYAAVPSTDRYHLYLDFQHEGVVRTATFSLSTSKTRAPDTGDESGDSHSDSAHSDES